MSKRLLFLMPVYVLALMGLTLCLGQLAAAPQHSDSKPAARSASQEGSPILPPSDAELRERSKSLIANQHRDDGALDLYERIERQVSKTGGSNPRTLEDKTYLVLPNGMGSVKLLLRSDGKPIDPMEYQRQLAALEDALELALWPDDPKTKTASAKHQKRMLDRAELVDAAGEAYIVKWLGREKWNARDCDVFQLDPNPEFHPRSMLQEILTHVTVKIWVDHASDQLARGEAHITRDVSIGGGILGKLYRGGVFSMEQTEVAAGVWLPTRYQYDFAGRKFLFPFEEHQVVEASQYRKVGGAKEALKEVQADVASGKVIGSSR
jgi:hypothetical protein